MRTPSQIDTDLRALKAELTAYREGCRAYEEGKGISSDPYVYPHYFPDPSLSEAWRVGYMSRWAMPQPGNSDGEGAHE